MAQPVVALQPWTPNVKLVVLTALAQVGFAVAWAATHGKQEFLLYALGMPVLLLVLARIHRRVRFSEGLLWGLNALLLLHLAGGLVVLPDGWPVESRHLLYDWWLIPGMVKYDHLVHTFGNALATWLCWQLLQRTVASKTGWGFRNLRPTPELLFFCVLAGMGIGSVNEIGEFVATKFVPDHGVGGYANTLVDLVANSVGSVLVAVILWNHGRQVCDPDTGLVCSPRK